MDDASPDGPQEVALELAKVYGENQVVSVRPLLSFTPQAKAFTRS